MPAALPDALYVEPYLVADPADTRHLVAAAIAFPPKAKTNSMDIFGRTASLHVFVSFDGGASWHRHVFSSASAGLYDPWVTFGTGHEVYVSCLASRDPNIQEVARVFRSRDGGQTWLEPVDLPLLPPGITEDHPLIVFDRTTGKYSNRLYLVTSRKQHRGVSRIVYALQVFASPDGGTSFLGLVEILPNDFNNWAGNAVVLSDGTVVVSFAEYGKDGPDGKEVLLHPRIWVVKSEDGGRTFPMPVVVTEEQRMESFPMMAVDTSSSTNKDRIYPVSSFPGLLHVWHCSEKGEQWSESTVPGSDEKGEGWKLRNPQVAVNNAGIVAVAWRNHLSPRDADCSQLFLSASADGGKAFLPGVPASTVSCTNLPGNQLLGGFVERWKAGGEYFGLTAGSDGVFRLLWPDSRDGHFSLWMTTGKVSPVSAGSPASR